MFKRILLVNKDSEASKLFFEVFSSVFTTKEYEVCDVTNASLKLNMSNAHIISFLEELKDCNSEDDLCCIFSEYARKFNCKKLNLVTCDETANFNKLLADTNDDGDYYAPCYSKAELLGFICVDAIEPDISFIVYLTNLAAMVLKYLRTTINENEKVLEVHEEQPFVQKVIASGIPENVTKYIPREYLINCDLNEIKKAVIQNTVGTILIGQKYDLYEAISFITDLREMYVGRDIEVIFFHHLDGSSDLKKVCKFTKFIVIPPQVLKHVRFQVNLKSFLYPSKPFMDSIYKILNEVYNYYDIHLEKPDSQKKYGLSISSLNRYSVKYIGIRFKEFEETVRIEHAKHLIDEVKNLSLAEISKLSNFNSYLTFETTFVRLEGHSPLDFKKRK